MVTCKQERPTSVDSMCFDFTLGLNDIESRVFGLCSNEMDVGWNKFGADRLADIF